MNASKARFLALAALAMPAIVIAHDGSAGHDFAHGFMHPLTGFDHLLAMLAVGMVAAFLGGKAQWQLPLGFLLMVAAGGLAGALGFVLPFTEIMIAVSVILLGLAVALQWSLPATASLALVGFFALFHGQAHGTGLLADASGLGYAAGFLLATAALHLAGFAAGRVIPLLAARRGRLMLHAAGGVMTLAGVGILIGRL